VTFQTIAEQWGRPEVLERYLARSEARYVPMGWRINWRREDYVKKSGSLEPRAAFVARLAGALNDAGVGLLAGTDAPTIPGVIPGFSLHDDLDRLVAAGFSRFQALSTATRMPGEYIRRAIHDAPSFGQVQPGFRADLILSNQNPLEDLSTLRRPEGVMSHGRWYDRAQRQALLDDVLADYSKAAAGPKPLR
ncbi:MAG: amidohydrolase, partial [Sphingomicrobium sp.]